jgi:hypothetical protein
LAFPFPFSKKGVLKCLLTMAADVDSSSKQWGMMYVDGRGMMEGDDELFAVPLPPMPAYIFYC